MSVFIVGYPYIGRTEWETFNFYPEKNGVFFLLPKKWTAKKGQVVFYPPKNKNVLTTLALFHHSDYPIIGGLFKGWMPLFPLALLRLKLRTKIDLVYNCNDPVLLTSLYNSFWAKIFGSKVVLFSWENIPYEVKFRGLNLFVKKLILNLNLFFCDGIVCGNKKGEAIFRERTSKPISVIPMSGFDGEFFKPPDVKAKREFEGFSLDGKIVFSFAGAIGFRKGILLAIEAFPLVLEQIPNSVLIISGSGEYEREIDQLINDLGLKRNIIRVPWLDQERLRTILAISDVFLYPSVPYGGWEEQFGYAMGEASLMELPVISTASGSIGEVVINGKTGILVRPGDRGELKDAMIRLGKDENLRKSLGMAGRRYIMENFSQQKIAQRFYDFFNKIQ